MQRLVTIGSAGAGKTTLSVELGRLLGLPVVHLDAHEWKGIGISKTLAQVRRSTCVILGNSARGPF